MLTFGNYYLLGGLALLTLPVLIHLINLVRQRRVRWAAMEFLLQSQRKNSSWIRLKEMLLLLARLAALAAVVLMLARPEFSGGPRFDLGGRRLQHVVLLDDSLSMSDRGSGAPAFSRAKTVVAKIGEAAQRDPRSQTLSVIRYSRAAVAGQPPDLNREPVNAQLLPRIDQALREAAPTELAVGPLPALRAIDRLLADAPGSPRVVYLVSDFRRHDWTSPGETADVLRSLADEGTTLRFVQCVDRPHGNLAITALAPEGHVRAAGVPLPMQVSVRNFGDDAVRDLSLVVEEDGQSRTPVTFDEIGPGREERRIFKAYFATPGDHSVTVRVPASSVALDAVPLDNARYCAVDMPVNLPVLIIDADPAALHGRYLALTMAPGGDVRLGIEPTVERPSALNTAQLANYRIVYLANVDRLDDVAVQNLEAFVARGGSVVVFLTEISDVNFFNQRFYRDGQGLFPLPLAGATDLLVDRLEPGADILVSADHPIFRRFTGQGTRDLASVHVDRFVAARKDWTPSPDSGTRVIARLRTGAPLIVDRSQGSGRIVVVLTSAAPAWNNWAKFASFVNMMLEMHSYLLPGTVETVVGAPLRIVADGDLYQPQARVVSPGGSAPTVVVLKAASGGDTLAGTVDATPHAGIYTATLAKKGRRETVDHLYAVNVNTTESDLDVVDRGQLEAELPDVPFEFQSDAQFSQATGDKADSPWIDALLYLLIALLVGEQILAYFVSYHPPTVEPR